MEGSINDGVQGGSNVITTSTDPTPDTRAALLPTPFFRKWTAGQPGLVAVIVMRAMLSTTICRR